MLPVILLIVNDGSILESLQRPDTYQVVLLLALQLSFLLQLYYYNWIENLIIESVLLAIISPSTTLKKIPIQFNTTLECFKFE